MDDAQIILWVRDGNLGYTKDLTLADVVDMAMQMHVEPLDDELSGGYTGYAMTDAEGFRVTVRAKGRMRRVLDWAVYRQVKERSDMAEANQQEAEGEDEVVGESWSANDDARVYWVYRRRLEKLEDKVTEVWRSCMDEGVQMPEASDIRDMSAAEVMLEQVHDKVKTKSWRHLHDMLNQASSEKAQQARTIRGLEQDLKLVKESRDRQSKRIGTLELDRSALQSTNQELWEELAELKANDDTVRVGDRVQWPWGVWRVSGEVTDLEETDGSVWATFRVNTDYTISCEIGELRKIKSKERQDGTSD